MRSALHAGGRQRLRRLLRGRSQAVHLQDGLRRFIVAFQERFGFFPAILTFQQRNQFRRMAVFERRLLRLRKRLSARHGTQNSVDQPRRLRIRKAFCLLHRLVDGGGSRDFIRQRELIDRQPQNVMHDGLQPFQPRKASQPVIQQHPVLQDAVAQPACQRGLAPVHAAQSLFQRGIRPRAGLPARSERTQRSVTGSHIKAQWDGRGNNPARASAFRRLPAVQGSPARRRRRRSPAHASSAPPAFQAQAPFSSPSGERSKS